MKKLPLRVAEPYIIAFIAGVMLGSGDYVAMAILFLAALFSAHQYEKSYGTH